MPHGVNYVAKDVYPLPQRGDLVNARAADPGNRFRFTGVATDINIRTGMVMVRDYSGTTECLLEDAVVYADDDFSLPGCLRHMRDRIRSALVQ